MPSQRFTVRVSSLLTRVALLVVVAALSGCGDTEFDTLSGDALNWNAQRGQWVFVNYWAPWCQPCRKEIPELNQFEQHHRDLVRVVGVNFDQPDDRELKRQTDELGIEFTQLTGDPAAQLNIERPLVLPATFVFDPSGNYRGVLMGPQTLKSLGAWLVDAQPQAR